MSFAYKIYKFGSSSNHKCHMVYILIFFPQSMLYIGDVSKLLLVLMRLNPIKNIIDIKIVGSSLEVITFLNA